MNAPLSQSSVPSVPASLVSFATLFGREICNLVITEIEIPLIQRDYAQGRNTQAVKRIREQFVVTLCDALMPEGDPVDLDFVFGDVEESGKFAPLDGQQRLTTLFLLQSYLAWRTGVDITQQPWSRFSYATRPGARDFCSFLANCRPEFGGRLSAWITDQPGYLATWRHDPTIQSMLTVLDTLDATFANAGFSDFHTAWENLTNTLNPAIRFHVLPVKANGLTDSLYIKMNSRGKSLTDFENFKAHFEALLRKAEDPKIADDFTKKVDTVWSDILWPYRDTGNLIDNEFLSYFRFITEVNAWRASIEFNSWTRDDDLAERVYGGQASRASESIDFLFHAFDTWKDLDIRTEFARYFRASATTANNGDGALLLFNPIDKEGVDLFGACCRHYGNSGWTLAHTLLFYGVLVHRREAESGQPNRLRLIRNLIEASKDEIRTGERNSMPRLLEEIVGIVRDGDLAKVVTFNQAQVRNEIAKADMLRAAPELKADLYKLEDHDLLRGGLTVFDLDTAHFSARAQAFILTFDKAAQGQSWKDVTAALLAKGDYSRKDLRGSNHTLADFGAPRNDEPWRELFRGKKGESIHPALPPLIAFLDDIVGKQLTPAAIRQSYLDATDTAKDWRYYFVKYEAMREGASGRYTLSPKGGYQACMLNKARLSSNYRDPYLLAIVAKSGLARNRIANGGWPNSFSGFETARRALVLVNSGLEIRSVAEGWEIAGVPSAAVHREAWDGICKSLGMDTSTAARLYAIPQTGGIDNEDRVEKGAQLLHHMAECNL
ncbi:hypothetical protein LMG28138_04883 [Pararobbsia alpina]|uniref:GmrSD restriction endonucleases N-terminal domain-containing protein n=1 Tax=Pararobbsia alpina TaxID=621374 RepID=A0A6S7CY13_9BURK|nr:hypothetical protein LMG28138_04883 [Pararobbsia alpina]